MILLVTSIVIAFILGLLLGLLFGSKSTANVKNAINDISQKIDDTASKASSISEDIEKLKGFIDAGVDLTNSVKEIPGVTTLADKIEKGISSQVNELTKAEETVKDKISDEQSNVLHSINSTLTSTSSTPIIVPSIKK